MLLRLLVYWGLAISALCQGMFWAAILCALIPLGGLFGMILAVIVGATFAVEHHYIEASLAVGVVAFNLAGHQLLRWQAARRRYWDWASKYTTMPEVYAYAKMHGLSLFDAHQLLKANSVMIEDERTMELLMSECPGTVRFTAYDLPSPARLKAEAEKWSSMGAEGET